ncbi:MAG TPA: hypothetical protein VL463_34675 [Kofleriaceae bacterium]|jgi:hypothetical protein|nr:hypothetical protein [Kofleriaceae bacterium]
MSKDERPTQPLRTIAASLGRRVRPHSPDEARVLDELVAHAEAMHIDHLAQRLALRPDQLAKIIDGLRADGAVTIDGALVSLTR